MRLSILLMSALFVPGMVSAVTLRDRFVRKNIPLEELAPELRIALVHNDRHEAIRAAVAIRDFFALETILFPDSQDLRRSMEEWKLVAVTAVNHGYNIMTCSVKLRAAYSWCSVSVYDEVFWLALRNGHADVAMSIAGVANQRWNPLESFVSKRNLQPGMVEGMISIFPEFIQYSVEKMRQHSNSVQAHSFVRSGLEYYYPLALAQVIDPEKRAELKELFITASILTEGSDIFYQNPGEMRPLRVEARTRIYHSLAQVSEHVCVTDVMGVITEHVDLENSRWLKLVSEFIG